MSIHDHGKSMETIWNEAKEAAFKAEKSFLEEHPHYHMGGPCGFAWVRIKPATGPFVKWCKARNEADGNSQFYGHKAYEGGWTIWNPGESCTQSIDVKEQGARAFATVLVKYGLNAWDESRLD